MIVGVIGSGSIGPDLAYGFISAIAKEGGKVFLHDIKPEALEAGMARAKGYVEKALQRGKLAPKAAGGIQQGLIPTLKIEDLKDCDYVLEAATEDLKIKKVILKSLEAVVRPDCLIGFATSGLPRKQIAAEAKHPARCFVNHPFFPAWRSPPIEVVPSEDKALTEKMLATLKHLGKVPIITADVECFAADDIFVNYCAEAARIVAEGTATPAQVDQIVNDAVGGGGPFNVMDLTRGNLLNVHCLQLMRDAPTGSPWFEPPPIFTQQANAPWHDKKNPGDPSHSEALKNEVLDRILAVLVGRTYFVVDNGICDATDFNWLSRMALGYGEGLLDLAARLGADRCHELCTKYAARFKGFTVPRSIQDKQLARYRRNVKVLRDGDIATIMLFRPEVKNALNDQTMNEVSSALDELGHDAAIKGIVLTSFDGAIAGADINELAALKDGKEAEEKCLRGQQVTLQIATMKKPVVAAVDGPVLGGGSEISMGCHGRVVGKELMVGQPEVNLGIIPGYGGTQRLPRLIGFERGSDLLRTGRAVGAREACEWGWANGEPATDPVAAAKQLLRDHFAGKVRLAPVNPEPVPVPAELPEVDIGEHSLAIDQILCETIRDGLRKPLPDGLKVEAAYFARCHATADYKIGMANFIINGPRVPAAFMHE
ncbi:MAG: 3-hydroxyacyl-CoA dehydrogenase/enoyl-CoA hydratase family protein [Deltaproteobacteria bacterium]|nr:3-hydroxyacyl-CoA dehydrogenase/enoyl-CoA hydratase family protein [Deltaproteobacteria bacterium]